MSHTRRRREEPASSHWEPPYSGPSHYDDHNWRHYAPPSELLPRTTFNYWRDEAIVPNSYYPQQSHGQRSYDDQWRDDYRSRHVQSSYSSRPRGFGSAYDWDDSERRRDRSPPPYRTPRRQHYSTYTPPPYPLPVSRARTPVDFMPPPPQSVPPAPPRKASSPPSPKRSFQPPKPSPGYLALSQEPSHVLQDYRISRKLLVLDLNGTLLIRSPRSRTSSGQLRAVQPRPYMQSFRQYLFCSGTKAWLDTMVWSSAQPHSVDDMVDKVFGPAKQELRAVWNRKSLGLSEAEYYRKTVTTKDLTKPWDLLGSALGPEMLQGQSMVPSQTVHSALTTLLLDDSPHKAALQPYNHVCIPEYDSTRRQHDLRSLLAMKEPKGGKRNKKAKQKDEVETVAHPTNHTAPGLSPGGTLSESTDKEPYDTTLLGIIGILDAIKSQSNVAGWTRGGGLWAIAERQGRIDTPDAEHRGVVEDGKTVLSAVTSSGNDTTSTSDPAVRAEQAHLQTKMWFDDSSVVGYWVARGHRVLMDLGIQVVHGVAG